MLDNSRIVHRRYLMAYGTALISAFLIFTINIELLTSQESTAQIPEEEEEEEECPPGTVREDVSSVIEAGRIITVSFTCSTPDATDTGEETPGPQQPEPDLGDDTNGDDTDGDDTNGDDTDGDDTDGAAQTGETEPDQEPTVPEEESNPSDVQLEGSQTIDESTSGATQSGVIHRNTTDGFQIQVPAGWVVEDIDNTNITTQMNEQQSGYTYLARICPLDNAVIVSVGRYQCEQGSTANVNIMRFNDLHQRPEFASLGNRDITTSDFLSYYVQFWQISDVQIWNNTDTTVNIINAQTNQIVATMPAKLVEYTYLYSPDGTTMTQGRDFTLLVLNGGIGYSLFYEGLASSLTSGTPPFQVDQVFDSFRLLTATPGG
jgi:hypothetical protein